MNKSERIKDDELKNRCQKIKRKVRLLVLIIVTVLNICNGIIMYFMDSKSIDKSILISIIVYALTIPVLIFLTNFVFGKSE